MSIASSDHIISSTLTFQQLLVQTANTGAPCYWSSKSRLDNTVAVSIVLQFISYRNASNTAATASIDSKTT